MDLYTELSRQEIGHTILVTHLDRLKYRKNSSRCHKIRYRKVRRFWPLHAKKIELYLQCEKKPGDVWNMCTGTQNCARKSLPRAVNFATCSCWPEFVVASARPFTTCGLGPTFHPRYARHTVEEALWTAACRIYAPAHADRNARYLAPSFQLRCWHCRSRSLISLVYVVVMLATYSHYATRSAWPISHAMAMLVTM